MAVTQTIALGPVRLTLQSDNARAGIADVEKALADDSEVMHEIADELVNIVRYHINAGPFLPLSDATLKRRQYPWRGGGKGGWGARGPVGSQPLRASDTLYEHIAPRSKRAGGYAAAIRGDAWYAFLHDRGVGRIDERPFVYLTPAEESRIAGIYDEWLGRKIEGDES